jgi:NAD(P)-dependent dehydrogenase (short-subunit alcohol dehydrogenase family)
MPAAPALLVTGASTGIGRAVARVAVAKGARVYASVRRQRDAEALRAELGERVQPILFDVTDEAAVAAAAGEIALRQQGRRLLGVVNNAGACTPGPLLAQAAADLRAQMEVNLIGQHIVTCAFAPLLGAEGRLALGEGPPGRFIMVSSVAGKRAMPFTAMYAASKHALEGYSEGLRRELLPFGIDVVIVTPGVVKTEIWGKGLALDRSRYAGSVYAKSLDRVVAQVVSGVKRGLEADTIGALVWTCLTTRRPQTRYARVEAPISALAASLIPTRMFDWMVGRHLGLLP